MFLRVNKRSGRTLGLTVGAALVIVSLSGCGFVGGLFGVGFETSYSPEQREVFRTNVQLGLSNLSENAPTFTPQELVELDESGIAICRNLDNFGREEVKKRLIEELQAETPYAPNALASRVAEVFIQASTAQGSLCSELR